MIYFVIETLIGLRRGYRMTRKWVLTLGIVIVAVVSLIGVIYRMNYNNIINPHSIMISQCKVSDEIIAVKGGFSDSANKFTGYKAAYANNTLYLKITGSILPLPKSTGDFNISIKNDYGHIQSIYLQGSDPSQNIRIWSSQQ